MVYSLHILMCGSPSAPLKSDLHWLYISSSQPLLTLKMPSHCTSTVYILELSHSLEWVSFGSRIAPLNETCHLSFDAACVQL